MFKSHWREKSKRVTNTIITTAFLAIQVMVPVATLTHASALMSNPPGNNGTMKVHEKGTPVGTESNDPHVCTFNFESFGLDANQTGNVTIEPQAPTSSNGTPSGNPLVLALTTNTSGDGETLYVNDTNTSLALQNGHYKATLDNKFGTEEGSKAKSKVFWVNCDKTAPSLNTTASTAAAKAGDKVHDTATLSGDFNHGTVAGSVAFYLCGPTTNAPDCTTGGSAVGNSVNVVNGQAVSADVPVTSSTASGSYCFRAVYSPSEASNYLTTKHTNQTTECFTVAKYVPPTPAKPTLAVENIACVANSGKNDQVKVTVTNTADQTNASVTYTVKVGASTQTIKLDDGQSGSLTFSDLPTGPYTVSVTGDDGTSVSWGTGNVANCPKPVIKACKDTDSTDVTEQNLNGFSFTETRAHGHNDFTSSGLHVYTDANSDGTAPRSDGTDKAAGYKGSDISLADVGNPVLNYTKNGGAPNVAPGYQLYIDNGHGVRGYVVHEPDYYGNNWWSKADFGVGAGGGYTSYAPLSDYLAANPDARVLAFGYSMGSGAKGDVTLQSIEFNCHVYKFVKPDTAQIRVQKELWPTNDKGRFNLNIDGQTNAPNVGNGGDTGYVTVPVGKHNVSETAGSNTVSSNYESKYYCYKETTWLPEVPVFNLLSTRTNNVTVPTTTWNVSGEGTSVSNLQLNKDDKLTCVFKNKHIPTITIVKDARPNSTQPFSFETNAQSGDFSLTDNGSNDGKQAKSFQVSGDEWYVFKEHDVAGWMQTNLSCDSGKWHVMDHKLYVSAQYGDNITCTFVNTKAATVTIVKDAQPNSTQAFTFTSNLSGSNSQFMLTDDGKNTAAATKQFTSVMPGSYTVSEGAMIGWTLSSVSCTNGENANLSGSTLNLRVNAGDEITCTYVNKMNTSTTGTTTGGKGGDVLGASTTAAVVTSVAPTVKAAELANTGDSSLWINVLTGAVAIVAALGLTIAARKQTN